MNTAHQLKPKLAWPVCEAGGGGGVVMPKNALLFWELSIYFPELLFYFPFIFYFAVGMFFQECFSSSWLYILCVLLRATQRDNICLALVNWYVWVEFCGLGTCFCTLGWLSFIFSSWVEARHSLVQISRLVFFLIRKQSSEGVIWRNYFQWTPAKTSAKESIFTLVASLQLHWKCAVL